MENRFHRSRGLQFRVRVQDCVLSHPHKGESTPDQGTTGRHAHVDFSWGRFDERRKAVTRASGNTEATTAITIACSILSSWRGSSVYSGTIQTGPSLSLSMQASIPQALKLVTLASVTARTGAAPCGATSGNC